MTQRDAGQLYRQLSATMNAGIPLGSALCLLSTQTVNPSLKRCLADAAVRVERGCRLSEVLEDYPSTFSGFQCATIATGEVTGRLDISFRELAAIAERNGALVDSVKRELLLPKITLVFSLPFLLAFFPGTNSSILVSTAIAVLLIVFSIVLLTQRLMTHLQVRSGTGFDSLAAVFPFLNKIVYILSLSRFARLFAALNRSGIAAGQALSISATACGNTALGQKIAPVVAYVERGESLESALARTRMLPEAFISLMKTGETTGSIDALMDYIADHYQNEASLRLHQLSVTLGVTALLTVGTLVGIIAAKAYGAI